MSSLADLDSLQVLPWMYINAVMQQYGVLRPGGDGIRVLKCSLLATQMGREYKIVGSVYEQSSRPG